MKDTDETPFDRYETTFDASEGPVTELDACPDSGAFGVDRLEAALDRLEGQFDHFEATIHEGLD